MADDITAKLGTATAMTITLASLASSSARVGRAATSVSNATTLYTLLHVYVSIKVGTPTAASNIYVHGLRGDGTIYDDAFAGTDGAETFDNSPMLGIIRVPGTTADVTYAKGFHFWHPGDRFSVGIWHDTGDNLDSTGTAQAVRYQGEYWQATAQ
jgi:hypothetical protein